MNGRGTPFMEQRATAIAGRSALAGSQEIAVPHEAVLRDALLRGVVDVCDAESLGIAEIPFEIVKQRPHEIAGQRHAFVDGALRRGEMTLEIVDAVRIMHRFRAVLVHRQLGNMRYA